MNHNELQHLPDLQQIYQNRLRPLERQLAYFGLRTSPDVLIEIDDLKQKIADTQTRI